MNEERKLFKDWFDRAAARQLADQIAAVWPVFDRDRFVRRAARDLHRHEFQARVQQFAAALAEALPSNIPAALDILTRSLPSVLPDQEVTNGWLQWPVGHFIAHHGVPYFEESMHAMTELTMRFSSEFAVRPFLIERPSETYERLYALTGHPNVHVRRWCSEGSRPRLPWGKHLPAVINDPSPSWPILEALVDDPELYVRKSVANHLNDIAKDHPDLVLARCRAWKKKASPERLWIIRHGLRTLIKAGHPEALALLGFAPVEGLAADLNLTPKRLRIGASLALSATLTNPEATPRNVAVDYVVHFVRPSGKPSAKVFKWTTLELPARASVTLRKNHPFRHATIRTLHPGKHRIELQVNGSRLAEAAFHLA